jgi:hypothetical protein
MGADHLGNLMKMQKELVDGSQQNVDSCRIRRLFGGSGS